MIKEPEFKKRMREELEELTIKMSKINEFLHADSIVDVDEVAVLMLQTQYHCMAAYRESLRGRMEYIGMFNKAGVKSD